MTLGPPGRRKEPLNVIWMALALAAAAFVGGGLGVLWHWAGFGTEEAAREEAGEG